MDANSANSLMNFAAGGLVFGAAIVPIVTAMWKRASAADKTDILISLFITVIGLLCLVGAFCSRLFFGSSSAALLLLIGSAAAQLLAFRIPRDQSCTRREIALLLMGLSCSFLLIVGTYVDFIRSITPKP
jgi:hypothetical protein